MTVEKVIPALTASTMATGDIIYYDVDQFQKVSVSTVGKVLTTVAGKPAWIEPSTSTTFYCILKKQAAQTIVGNATVTYGATSEIYDTEGFHDPVTNPERITIPSGGAGLYLCGANILWDSDTSGGREIDMIHGLSGGGTSGILQAINASGAANASPATISVIRQLADGDYVYVNTFESSSGSPQVRANSNFWAYRLQA
jgi:hypothetical protein